MPINWLRLALVPLVNTEPIENLHYITLELKLASRSIMPIQLQIMSGSMIAEINEVSVVGEKLTLSKQTGRLQSACSRAVVQQWSLTVASREGRVRCPVHSTGHQRLDSLQCSRLEFPAGVPPSLGHVAVSCFVC